jgi:hypothetical protein
VKAPVSGTLESQLSPCAKVEKRELLERISGLSPLRFVLVISIIFVFQLFLGLLIWRFLSEHYHLSLKEDPIGQLREKFGWYGLFLIAVLFMPIIETGLGQALPIVIAALATPWIKKGLGQALPNGPARFLSRPTTVYLFLATVWFSYLHAMDQQGSQFWIMILSHVVSSLILACTFLHGWMHSWWRGIWMTSVVHIAGNLSIFLYELVTGG